MAQRGLLLGSGKTLAQAKLRRAGFVAIGARNTAKGQVRDILARTKEAIGKVSAELVKRQVHAYSVGGHQEHGGAAWTPLADATVKKKRSQGGPTSILVDAYKRGGGQLRDSIVADEDGTKAKKTSRGVGFSIKIVAKSPIGRFHATGFRNVRTKKKVPPRPPVEYTPADVEFVMQAIRNALAASKAQNSRGKRGGRKGR